MNNNLVEQLQKYLESKDVGFPGDFIEQISEQPEQYVDKLLSIVDEFFTHPKRYIFGEKFRELFVILIILAKVRDKRAFLRVAKLCSMPYNAIENFVHDVPVEFFPALLASTFDGDLIELELLAINMHLDERIRDAALRASAILYKNDIITRDDILNSYSRIFNMIYDDFSKVPSTLVLCCCEIEAGELSEQIAKYSSSGAIDFGIVDFDLFFKCISEKHHKDFQLGDFQKGKYDFVDYDIEYMGGWLFAKKEARYFYDDYDEGIAFHNPKNATDIKVKSQVSQFVRETPKIGRNDICSCGSGKKYKKCCL